MFLKAALIIRYLLFFFVLIYNADVQENKESTCTFFFFFKSVQLTLINMSFNLQLWLDTSLPCVEANQRGPQEVQPQP